MFGKLNIFRVSTENVHEEAEATSRRQQQGAGGTGEGGGAFYSVNRGSVCDLFAHLHRHGSLLPCRDFKVV